MGKTSIEWVRNRAGEQGHTINPIRARLGGKVGHYCEKTSLGCRNCYASTLQRRFGMPPFQEQRRSDVKPFLDAGKLEEVLRRKKPTGYFWNDMSDMFGEWVPNEWIAACFGVMAATPQHTHYVVTKRARRMREWFDWIPLHRGSGIPFGGVVDLETRRLGETEESRPTWNVRSFAEPVVGYRLDIRADRSTPFDTPAMPWPLPNVVLMVSAENQKQANARIPELLATPAAVRGVSAEPLLGPVVFDPAVLGSTNHLAATFGNPLVNWVIVGGESGPRARNCNAEWIRSVVEQCKSASVACFVKQLGSGINLHTDWDRGRHVQDGDETIIVKDRKGGDPAEWPEDLRVRQMPEVAR